MAPTVEITISAAEIMALRQFVLVCEALAAHIRDEEAKRGQTNLTNALIAVVARADFAADHT